jgi:N-acetylglucosamine-6-phosphate deacetylase
VVRGRDVFTGEPVELEIAGDRISARSDIETEDDLPWLSPGWFDIQVNGWTDHDWNGESLEAGAAEQMCTALAQRGTTSFLATIITADRHNLVQRLSAVRRFCEQSPIVSRSVAGVHVEGPFISEMDGPRGAHTPSACRDPSVAELDEWHEASGGRIRMVTLAPERNGAAGFIRELRRRGIVPAIGHTNATREEIHAAIEAGALFSTHVGNGIGEQIHRHHNPIWTQLAADELTAGIIADRHHLPPDVLRTVLRAKSSRRVVVVSDANVPGGRTPGIYTVGNNTVELDEGGRLGLAGTSYLAGAGHLLDRAVHVLVEEMKVPVCDVASMMTINPHRLFGHGDDTFSLRPGGRASLVLFRTAPGGNDAFVERVLIDGEDVA